MMRDMAQGLGKKKRVLTFTAHLAVKKISRGRVEEYGERKRPASGRPLRGLLKETNVRGGVKAQRVYEKLGGEKVRLAG